MCKKLINDLDFSWGQVVAVAVAVKPLDTVAKLLPRVDGRAECVCLRRLNFVIDRYCVFKIQLYFIYIHMYKSMLSVCLPMCW